MNDTSDRIQLAIAVGGAIAAIMGFLWQGLPLSFFFPVIFGLVLMSLYIFIRWKHEGWDPSKGKTGAQWFGSVVHRLHGAVRLGLWVLIVACALSGIGVKLGPDWAAAEARDTLLRESPATHPDLAIRPCPAEFGIKSKKDPVTAGEAYIIIARGNEARLERSSNVLGEIIEDIFDPVSWLAIGLLAMIFLILLILWFAEVLGQRTYEIP